MIYPEHIYDPKRKQLVIQLMAKELSKLFPEIHSEDVLTSITGWTESPEHYHLEDSTRDFWDIFSAIFEQIKLKPGFTNIFTAENYNWERREITVSDIQLTSHLDQIKQIPGLSLHPQTTVGDIVTAAKNASILADQQRINDTFSSQSQDSYPIIVRRLPDGQIRVNDGNRRSLRAGLYGKETIDAWVGSSDDDQPKNYWIPVGELYQLVRYYRYSTTDEQKQAVRNMLEVLFQLSPIARINYDSRIASETDITAEFLAMKPTI
ncbi:hypothetical protein A2707_04735 [Candidatus Saccharibacteria bacterium RIFCSPHIGHO2_01_FULL_45_15]|nr:MAG: hypothetical protein A2707_04735 [Candidatus Saccharibacteria bacterium RIFCSPHIGHO2_01_FULL_45_15]OGL32722.1 MAG: hypothetical protein A3E76_05225 [Candidatus Saccharibacteria bacterium RIFCSPHIGHO2_12_FULL_44_22]